MPRLALSSAVLLAGAAGRPGTDLIGVGDAAGKTEDIRFPDGAFLERLHDGALSVEVDARRTLVARESSFTSGISSGPGAAGAEIFLENNLACLCVGKDVSAWVRGCNAGVPPAGRAHWGRHMGKQFFPILLAGTQGDQKKELPMGGAFLIARRKP